MGRSSKAIGPWKKLSWPTGTKSARLAHGVPPKDITITQDETLTGGLCLVGIEPVSNSMVLEQPVQAREQDTWQELMAQALAGLTCTVIQSTSDEASGLLAYIEHHLGAQHSPDIFQVQHELSKAVSAPMDAKQQAAHQAVAQATETLNRVHERLDNANSEPAKRGPGRPPRAAVRLEQVTQAGAAARHKPQRLAERRETVTQSIHACPARTPERDLSGADRKSRACGTQNASHHRMRLRGYAPEDASIGLGAARVLCHARPSHSVIVSRSRGCDADGHSRGAAACVGRAPSHSAV